MQSCAVTKNHKENPSEKEENDRYNPYKGVSHQRFKHIVFDNEGAIQDTFQSVFLHFF